MLADVPGSAPDGRMVAIDNQANGVAEVAQQVPTVRDLNHVGSALAHTVRVGSRPVACDDLDAEVLAKTGGQGLGLPGGQEVGDGVALEIDQGGAIPMVAPPGLVIDGEDARRQRLSAWGANLADQPQQRVRAGWHGELLAQAPAGLAAEHQADLALQAAQPLGASCASPGDTGYVLGVGPAVTGRVEAAEPPRLDVQRNQLPLPRQVGERAAVSVVERRGLLAARGTGRRLLARVVWMVTASKAGRTWSTVGQPAINGRRRLERVVFAPSTWISPDMRIPPPPRSTRQHAKYRKYRLRGSSTST